ncbi:MAG: hypothetical protein ACLQVI_43745 [Polyangiaceae bacterium]|jgi:hypothetical protein
MAPSKVRALGSFLLAAVACGSAPPRLDAGVYREGPLAFRVGDVPPSWHSVHVDGATLAYRDEGHLASILLDGRCYRKDDDVPLLALTDHLVMGTTDRQIASQETVPFDEREAMHTRLRAKLDGVPMDYDIFVLKKDGCVYDFVYVADPSKNENGEAGAQATATATTGASAFERFVATFHTLPGAGAT